MGIHVIHFNVLEVEYLLLGKIKVCGKKKDIFSLLLRKALVTFFYPYVERWSHIRE